MASLPPETVLEIILHLTDTINIQIHKDRSDATLVMPPELSAELLPRVKAWIESPFQILLPEKLGILISHLAQGEQVNAALELAHVLLGILPGSGARFDIWYYEEILQKHIPSLVTASGLTTLELLCKLLDDAMSLESGHSRKQENSSYIWRPAIEEHQQNTPQGLRGLPDLLVSSVRDAAEQIVREQKASVKDVVFQLKKRNKLIYHRIWLYLLSIFPTSVLELVAEQLTNPSNFDNVELRHEYTLLAKAGFAQLSSIDQSKILGWINEAPRDLNAYRLFYERQTGQQSTDELINAYVNHWRRVWLARLGPNLPLEWRQLYEKLVAEYGPPEHPEFILYRKEATFIEPTSAIAVNELNSMSVKNLISYLNTWKPSQDFMDLSPQGLSRILPAVVEANVDRFATEARQFRKLDPIYVSGILLGFENAAKRKTTFLWEPLLDLCNWVIDQDSEISRRNNTDWIEGRKAIALLLSNGFESGTEEIPFTLRTKAWKALRALSEDPNPTPEEEISYSNSNMDPATLALNTVRGEAMHAAIRYALWVMRNLKEENKGKEQIPRGFNEMPEVRTVLNRHLNPDYDTSLAIRSVYGQWLPWLILLDSRWAIQNKTRIFPTEELFHKLRNAVWESYIVFCAPLDNVFDIFQLEYSHAVERIGTALPERRHPFTPDERLAEHMMILYWRGKVNLNEATEILLHAFIKGHHVLRAHALKFVGLSLYNTKDSIPPPVLERLKEL